MINFYVEDFEATDHRLKQYGAHIDGEVKEDDEVKVACYRSIDGVMISVAQVKKKELLDEIMSTEGKQSRSSESIDAITDPEKRANLEEVRQILRNIKI